LAIGESPFIRLVRRQYQYIPNGSDEPGSKRWYEAHNEDVKGFVPEDKLLVYNVKEGWAPLCRFLEKPVPECDFPRLFDKNAFTRNANIVLGRRKLAQRLRGVVILGISFLLLGIMIM
jgi:hypothetical protein